MFRHLKYAALSLACLTLSGFVLSGQTFACDSIVYGDSVASQAMNCSTQACGVLAHDNFTIVDADERLVPTLQSVKPEGTKLAVSIGTDDIVNTLLNEFKDSALSQNPIITGYVASRVSDIVSTKVQDHLTKLGEMGFDVRYVIPTNPTGLKWSEYLLSKTSFTSQEMTKFNNTLLETFLAYQKKMSNFKAHENVKPVFSSIARDGLSYSCKATAQIIETAYKDYGIGSTKYAARFDAIEPASGNAQ